MPDRYRIVVLDRPVDHWACTRTQELFGKLVGLRLDGYRAHYPPSVLPVDTYDFVSTHLLVCRETGCGLVPLLGYRETPLAGCKAFNLPFPALAHALSVGADGHARVIRSRLERCEQEGKTVAFVGSWTIDPGARRDRGLFRDIWELLIALYANHNREQGIHEAFAGAVLRLRTEKLLGACGLVPLRQDGALLPPVGIPHLLGEQVRFMHRAGIPEAAHALADKWRGLWAERIVVGPTKDAQEAPGSVTGAPEPFASHQESL